MFQQTLVLLSLLGRSGYSTPSPLRFEREIPCGCELGFDSCVIAETFVSANVDFIVFASVANGDCGMEHARAKPGCLSCEIGMGVLKKQLQIMVSDPDHK